MDQTVKQLQKLMQQLLVQTKKTCPPKGQRPNNNKNNKRVNNNRSAPRRQQQPRRQAPRNNNNKYYKADETMVKQKNLLNTQGYFTGNNQPRRSNKGKVDNRRPAVNHQNQSRTFTNSAFKSASRRRVNRPVSAYSDQPIDGGSGVELSEYMNSKTQLPVSIYRSSGFEGLVTSIPLKRTLIFEKGLIDLTRNLATGWYAAIRKSCIRFGPKAINDKYFVDQAFRQTSGSPVLAPTNLRYDTFVTINTLMINFLQNLLIANYNYLVQNDIQKLLTRLPQHLAFAITVAARKYVMRVKNGITNLATRLPHVLISDEGLTNNPTYFTVGPSVSKSSINLAFVPPMAWLAGGSDLVIVSGSSSLVEVPGLLNYLYAVQQHQQYPFTTVDDVQEKLTGLTHYDDKGSAVPIDLNLKEIVSVYGYTGVIGGSEFRGSYIHDLSGLEQTKISGVFRTLFFPQIRFDSPDDYSLLPDEFNDRLNTDFYYDNYMMAIYYGMTGIVPNVDYMLTAQMPYGTSRDDINQTSGPTSRDTLSVNSKGLNYLLTKYSSNETRPQPYRATTRALPTFPTVTFSPHAFNLAIAMAQKMNNRYYDFTASPTPTNVIDLFTIASADPQQAAILSPILAYQRGYYTMLAEFVYQTGVWVIQYDNRFVLPSPIIEDFKPYNSYNTWTYKGTNNSVGVQLVQQNLGSGRGSLTIPTLDDPAGGMNNNSQQWYMKSGLQFSSTVNFTNLYNYSDQIYQTYDGILYSPFNFDLVLDGHNNAMNEIRPYVKLNNCPEYETSLPSMHTLYLTSLESSGTTFYTVYTPLSSEDYTKKNVAIFIKVCLMPILVMPENINIPMLNVTNVPSNMIGTNPAEADFQSRTLFNLYQYSFVASYSGSSSELDFYYEQLRKNMIGSWSDLLPMFQNLASTMMTPMGGGSSPMNMIFDMLKPKGKGKASGFGANGDMMSMLNTILGSIGNLDENGSNTVNTPKSSGGGSSFWSGLGDIALKAAPMLLEML